MTSPIPALRPALALALATLPAAAAFGGTQDDAMLALANRGGCLTCHHVEPGAKGLDGMAPIGPAWRDVAAKYRNMKDAPEQLTHTVMTGPNP